MPVEALETARLFTWTSTFVSFSLMVHHASCIKANPFPTVHYKVYNFIKASLFTLVKVHYSIVLASLLHP